MPSRFKTGGSVIAIAGVAAAISAVPAGATVAVSSFTLTPSTSEAGSAPDITVNAQFAPTSGDDPKSVTISLAPGLLANPTVPTTCSQSQLAANQCPTTSQIGTGTVTASELGLPLTANAKLYMVTPNAGEAGRVGMIATSTLGNVVAQPSRATRPPARRR